MLENKQMLPASRQRARLSFWLVPQARIPTTADAPLSPTFHIPCSRKFGWLYSKFPRIPPPSLCISTAAILAESPPFLAGFPAPPLPLAAHSQHSSQSKPPTAQNPAELSLSHSKNQALTVVSRPRVYSLSDHPLPTTPSAWPVWPNIPGMHLPQGLCADCSFCLECFSHRHPQG